MLKFNLLLFTSLSCNVIYKVNGNRIYLINVYIFIFLTNIVITMSCCYVLILFLLSIIILKIFEYILRKRKLSNILNRHVFITGCDSGFGFSLAKCLDEIGVPVFASCLTEKGKKNLQERCSSRLKTLLLDVTDEKSINEAVKFVQKNLPKGQGEILNNLTKDMSTCYIWRCI